jgi:hypothetical protein
MPPPQRHKLLTKSQIFKKQGTPSAEHPQNRAKQQPQHVDHVMLLQHTAVEEKTVSC